MRRRSRPPWLADRCVVCGAYTEDAPHHRIPKSRGGRNTQDNLRPVCLQCHAEYHDVMGMIPNRSADLRHRAINAANLERLVKRNPQFIALAPGYVLSAFRAGRRKEGS